MPKSNEGDPRDKTFQNGADNHDQNGTGEENVVRISYDQLVNKFRTFISQKQEENRAGGYSTSLEKIIRNKLWPRAHGSSDERESWEPLLAAWNIITLHKLGQNDKKGVTDDMDDYLMGRRETTITLTRYQSSILEALADAAELPHQKGQTEFEIPQSIIAEIRSNTYRQEKAKIFEDMFTPSPRRAATVFPYSPRRRR